MYKVIKATLEQAANPDKATVLAKFFKTGKGQYGEGDVFIGVNVPTIRRICKQFDKQTTLDDIQVLLHDPIHEVRLSAVLMLVTQFEQANEADRKTLYDFYLKHTLRINNWDLVDSSARQIVGCYLFDKPRSVLYQLADSTVLWEQRVAIVATFYFIKRDQFDDTFNIAERLLTHPHDLIHKAVGWMLRETGKKNHPALAEFLNCHYQTMPRTMLRYAIEKFPQSERQHYLAKTARNTMRPD